MCALCFPYHSRPRVYATCKECRGVGVNCQVCRGRGYDAHEVSFSCECDGCLEFQGKPHAGRVHRTQAPPEIQALFVSPSLQPVAA